MIHSKSLSFVKLKRYYYSYSMKHTSIPKQTTLLILFTIFCLTILNCKKNDNDSMFLLTIIALLADFDNATSISYGGIKSPGNVLTGELVNTNDGTFNFTNLTTNEKIFGNVSTFSSSPFIELSSDSKTAIALPIKSVGLFATPFNGENTSSTTMRAEVYTERNSNCANMIGTFNTVQAMFGNAVGAFQGGYGTLTITGTDQKFASGIISTLGSAGPGTPINLSDGTCVDSKITWPTGETAFISFTGVLILDMGTDKGGFFGLAKDNSMNGSAILNNKTFFGFNNLRGTNDSIADNFVSIKFTCAYGACKGVSVDPRDLTPLNVGNSSTNVPLFTNGMSSLIPFGSTGGGVPLSNNDNVVIITRTVKGRLVMAMIACSSGNCTSTSSRYFGFYTAY